MIDPTLLNLLYGAVNASPKKSLSEIKASSIDMTQIPPSALTLPYLPQKIKDLLYYTYGHQKRSNPDLDAYINTLAPNRAAAGVAGYDPQLINLLYEPDAGAVSGKKRDPRELRRIAISITGISDYYNAINSLHLRGATPAFNLILSGIAESVSTLDAAAKLRLLGDRFIEVNQGALSTVCEDGELYVTCTVLPGYKVTLQKFISSKDYPQEVGAYLNSNTDDIQDLIFQTGIQIIEAARRLPI